MHCPIEHEETVDDLLDYAVGRLEPAKLSQLRRHVATCEKCANFTLGYREISHALDCWQAPEVTSDFNRRVLHRIEMEPPSPWYRVLFDFRFSPRLATAILVLWLLAIVGFTFNHSAGSAEPAGPRIDASQANRLEATLDDLQLLHQLDSSAPASY